MQQIQVTGIGWVLPASTGSGNEILEKATSFHNWTPQDNAHLADFSAKPYLNSVKGYLDPASSFCLAASVLAMGQNEQESADVNRLHERCGICTSTRYGATLSGYRFFQQFLEKGARFASPLIFPHSYPNTAGNLAAIEFGFGGPHMVYYGDQDAREGFEFAAARLADGTARVMLVSAYESAEGEVLPDDRTVMHGAIALRLEVDPENQVLCTVDLATLRDLTTPSTENGMTAAMLDLLPHLQR